MNIAVIGTGYVGLVVGSCFAESGNDVVCVDNNTEKIANLEKGIIPIYEPGLPDLIERNVRDGRLVFTTDIRNAIQRSKVIFIAVGTPTTPSGATRRPGARYSSLSAQPAWEKKWAAAIGTSKSRVSRIGLPLSIVSATANSRARSFSAAAFSSAV